MTIIALYDEESILHNRLRCYISDHLARFDPTIYGAWLNDTEKTARTIFRRAFVKISSAALDQDGRDDCERKRSSVFRRLD